MNVSKEKIITLVTFRMPFYIKASEIKAHYRQYLLDMLCKYKTEHFDYNKECMGMLLEELREFVIKEFYKLFLEHYNIYSKNSNCLIILLNFYNQTFSEPIEDYLCHDFYKEFCSIDYEIIYHKRHFQNKERTLDSLSFVIRNLMYCLLMKHTYCIALYNGENIALYLRNDANNDPSLMVML